MKFRKILFSAPDRIELVENEMDPSVVPAGHVIIKTWYSLISPGTELACLAGSESWFVMPRAPGYAAVGEVVATGEGAAVNVGDRVFHYGRHEECVLCGPQDILVRVPVAMDARFVPFARMANVAITALRVSEIELGDWVVVVGQGLVGNFAAQLARLQGARVIALDISEPRLALARASGVEYTLNPARCDVRREVLCLTGGAGASTVIEASGSSRVALEALPLTAKRGEFILLGSPRGAHQGNVTDVLNYCHLNDRGCINFKGAHEWRYPGKANPFVKHSIERNAEIVLGLILKGRLKTKPLLSHMVRPEDVQSAYDGLRERKDDYLGVIIDWR